MEKIILASSSPRRKELLQNLNLSFEIIPSCVDENLSIIEGNLYDKVMKLSYIKGESVAKNLDSGLVISADTIVTINDKILGKPKDKEDAIEMLTLLNGKVHEVITGVSLIDIRKNVHHTFYESTKVYFNDLSREEILKYVASEEPLDKAGSYGIQGLGSLLVKKIDGCYFNVVGLPLNKLNIELKKFNIFLL